jgi:hypothetical protein
VTAGFACGAVVSGEPLADPPGRLSTGCRCSSREDARGGCGHHRRRDRAAFAVVADDLLRVVARR